MVTSFFALGGDSLKAGKLVAAMRRRLEVQLSVADLFTAPTIGAAYSIGVSFAASAIDDDDDNDVHTYIYCFFLCFMCCVLCIV